MESPFSQAASLACIQNPDDLLDWMKSPGKQVLVISGDGSAINLAAGLVTRTLAPNYYVFHLPRRLDIRDLNAMKRQFFGPIELIRLTDEARDGSYEDLVTPETWFCKATLNELYRSSAPIMAVTQPGNLKMLNLSKVSVTVRAFTAGPLAWNRAMAKIRALAPKIRQELQPY